MMKALPSHTKQRAGSRQRRGVETAHEPGELFQRRSLGARSPGRSSRPSTRADRKVG